MRTIYLHETLRKDLQHILKEYKDNQIRVLFNTMENGKYLIHYHVRKNYTDEWKGVLEEEGIFKISSTNKIYCEAYIQSLIDFGYDNLSIRYLRSK